jgi:hypothetical protein
MQQCRSENQQGTHWGKPAERHGTLREVWRADGCDGFA